MSKSNKEIGRAYYQAMANKDRNEMAQYLHETVSLLGPAGLTEGKEALLNAAEKLFPFLQSINIRTAFENANQAALVYDMTCPDPVGKIRATALFDIQDGLINKIELFFDFRPFEKLGQFGR